MNEELRIHILSKNYDHFFNPKDKYILQKVNYNCIIATKELKGANHMRLFKKNEVQDEWIVHTKNKIFAEIYILVIIICGISIVAKYFIYDFSMEYALTEFAIVIAAGIYYLYRSVRLGLYSTEIELQERKSKWSVSKKNLILGISFGFGIALLMGINSAVQYADGIQQSIYYFLLVGFVSLIIYLPLFVIFLVVVNEIARRKSERAMDQILAQDDVGQDDVGDDDEKKY